MFFQKYFVMLHLLLDSAELYLDNGELFFYLDDFHIPIPISERWSYYLPNRINVGIDIDPHNKITITIKDSSNNREIRFNLLELLPKEALFSMEQNQKTDNSKEEQEYLDSVRDYLEESDARGKRLLNRLRERLGFSEERAAELEASLQSIQLADDEKEYLEEYKACLEEGEISSKERRLLDRLRDRLGISEERAKELETL